MKKLSMAVILMAVGVTFANAQSKEAAKKKTNTEAASLRADTSAAKAKAEVEAAQMEAVQEAQIKAVPVEESDMQTSPAIKQEKATTEKKDAKKESKK